MSFILVQFWGPLLIPVPENPMGDVTGGSQPPSNYPGSPPVLGTSQSRLSTPGASELHEISDQYLDPSADSLQHIALSQQQLFSQQQLNSYQLRQNLPLQLQTSLGSSQSNIAQVPIMGHSSSFNMSSLGAALPDNINYGQSFVQQPAQRFPSVPSQAGLVYPLQHTVQYPGQMAINSPHSPPYNMQYQQQYSGKYAHQPTFGQLQQPGSGSQQYMQHPNFMGAPHQHQQSASTFFYPQGQFNSPTQMYSINSPQQYSIPYSSRNFSGETSLTSQQRSAEQRSGQTAQNAAALAKPGILASSGAQTAILRGPPRKPKQSGHALWVGNLPPGANVVDLKDHFSREATTDILSVFLISKSNCAFVNYKTEESCAAAMTRFHDSRFQGVRLVCRLRRSSVNTVPGVPTGPAAVSTSQLSTTAPSIQTKNSQQETVFSGEAKEEKLVTSTAKDKYFIVKSLTVEDLELSVRNGVWATQSHNEEALNKAYETADNVYLIFSANKSGEYFGYARMASPINDDPAAAIEFAPKAQAVEDPDLPKAISTVATEFAPKGRIIDDSARGTIFWEAETDDVDVPVENDEQRSEHSDQEPESNSPAKAWGKPFAIEWLSTNRLPFYRTRGLRNPWNSNREVKIARDGTELETSVGRRLTQMFHREASPTATTMPNVTLPMIPSMMGGYPQMRQY